MLAKNLRKSLLNYAISGKLTAKWRQDNPINFKKGKFFGVPNAPFTIPNSWQWVKLGEICEIISGTSYNKQDIRQNGIRILRGGNINKITQEIDLKDDDVIVKKELLNETKNIRFGDILITSTNDISNIAKCGFVKENIDKTQIGAFLRIIRVKDNFLKKFIFYIIASEYYEKYIQKCVSGTVSSLLNIKNEYLNNFLIPLPPLDEQEFIVKELEKLMVLCDDCEKEYKALKQANAELHKLDKSLLNYAISGALSAKWRKDNPTNFNNGKFSELPNAPFAIPGSWQWVKLGEICEITDGTHKTPKYTLTGIPFLSVKDISKGYIDLSNTKFISNLEHKELVKRCKPEKNDILLCRIGTLGKAIKIDIDLEFSIFVSLALLKEKKPYTKDYLVYVLNSNFADNIFQVIKAGAGTHAAKLNLTSLKEILIPLPPLEEQKFIVGELDKLMGLCDELKGF